MSLSLIGKWLPRKITVLALGFSLFSCMADAKPKPLPELEEIREEISLLNLLRGLYLSREQAREILALAEKAGEMRANIRRMAEKDKGTIVSAFKQLRDSLYLPPGNEKETQEKAKTLDHRIKEAVFQTQDKIADLEKNVGEILTSAQRSVIAGFKPCLIPPKDFKNPVRVGQVSGGDKMAHVADLIHATPDDVWRERGNHLLSKISAKMEEESGEMAPALKTDLENRMREVAEKIRKCPDVDYPLRREGFSEALMVINPKKTSKHGFHKPGQLAKWFLSDVTLEVFPRWIKELEKPAQSSKNEVDEDCSEIDDPREIGPKILNGFNRLYKKRQRSNKMPPVDDLLKPIEAALEKNDRDLLVENCLAAIDKMIEIEADRPAAKALTQLARQTARMTGFPLLNPNQDPYGLSENLKEYLALPDPVESCKKVRNLIDTLRKFKRK